jgi:mono/diheme cytochrome c family protein
MMIALGHDMGNKGPEQNLIRSPSLFIEKRFKVNAMTPKTGLPFGGPFGTLMLMGTVLLGFAGCGKSEAEFETNRVYLAYQENQTNIQYQKEQVQDIVNAVAALFGTPDDPFFVRDVEGADELLSLSRIKAAAGPVQSDRYGEGEGLYRQHCVHCHGITGNGRGPTAAFLNPYPRDFTRGTFKFKSTPIGIKPTDDDLRLILINGVAGTAMPSFALLSSSEINALVDYVKYLAIRGETERMLMQLSPDFFDVEDPSKNEELRKEFYSREFLIDEVLSEVVAGWTTAVENVTEVPERPSEYDPLSPEYDLQALRDSTERGRKLYYTSVANCYSCHGPSQLGDGQVTDYDQWTKEYFDWTNKNADNYEAELAKYQDLGGLPPRNILPRNLRSGIYRGGRRPVDIFWRVHNGIDGTPMPAANKAALSDNDIWDIVNYVLALPYEPASRPGLDSVTNEREVN